MKTIISQNFSKNTVIKNLHYTFQMRATVLKIYLLLLILLCHTAAWADTVYTVESLPNPKSSPSFHYVSNPDEVLTATTVIVIDTMLKRLELASTCQVAVVVINSIGETVPKAFATKLFNYWGIGDREKDNGLLILMVMDQRSIEFETGKGMEGILPDVTCKYIQETFMVPYAKSGNYDACIVGGVKAVDMYITDPENAPEVMAENSSAFGQSFSSPFQQPVSITFLGITGFVFAIFTFLFRPRKEKVSRPEQVVKNKNNFQWIVKTLLVNIGIPAVWIWSQLTYDPPVTVAELLIAVYIFIIILLLERRLRFNHNIESLYGTDRAAKHAAFSKSHQYWQVTYFLFPIPFLIYKLFKDQKLDGLRNTPYACDKCNNIMQKLDENADDQYLSKGQLVEEQIHSVDYDVWHCYHCKNQFQLSYINYSSKYTSCKHCKAKASYLKGRNTITSPSYTSSGTGEKIMDCMNCHKQDREIYKIPMLQHSSSSSGGSSGSSGSSGGSSWGGGSSGGGGSGSKW
ncbi:MAG: TPM domain-containing protein [Chitinophagales bacterium]